VVYNKDVLSKVPGKKERRTEMANFAIELVSRLGCQTYDFEAGIEAKSYQQAVELAQELIKNMSLSYISDELHTTANPPLFPSPDLLPNTDLKPSF
jgi:hypothetical protein